MIWVLGVATVDGNMEGKELRFGIFNSSLFASITAREIKAPAAKKSRAVFFRQLEDFASCVNKQVNVFR
jgi:K+-transporting ATPase A subunit